MIQYTIPLHFKPQVNLSMIQSLLPSPSTYFDEVEKLVYEDDTYTYVYHQDKHTIMVSLDAINYETCPLIPKLLPYMENDGMIPYSLDPIMINEKNQNKYNVASFYQNISLPIIYIPSINHRPIINPDKLKRQVGLLAHVFYEANENFSSFDNVMIIYPNKQQTSFIPNKYIYDRITSLILHFMGSYYPCEKKAAIKAMNEKIKVELEIASAEAEFEMNALVDYLDDNKSLALKIEELKEEIALYQNQGTKVCILKHGKDEEDKYDYEQHDLIVSVLEDYQKFMPENDEEFELIDYILSLNPIKGEHHQWLEELFHFGRSVRKVHSTNLKLLRKYQLDFIKQKSDGHWRVFFEDGDKRYAVKYSSSPSDGNSTEHTTKELVFYMF